MDISKLREPLTVDQIDFRIQSISEKGWATILAYKDARVDQQRLDEVVGPLNWKREHTNNNHNCIVSIFDASKGEWVSKEDVGTESNTEKEKGLASDSFKRACFNWGIGRELYDYPFICVQLKDGEWEIRSFNGKERGVATWNLKLRDWIWFSQFKDGRLSCLAASDENGNRRFTWGKYDKDL